ncbi:MAG: two-component sensor histidine kinase, partial [Oxalobacteraceae bacterium]|nr:two-component sensor histidine kinase [Oxalobacteraceae bacterium]
LAGISHDLRTPIARMLLEVEMGSLSDEAKRGMQSDLAQMESIIAQFLDYARPAEPGTHAKFDLSAVVKQTVQEAQRSTDSELHCAVLDDLFVIGNPVEIARAVSNLIENARRYGKSTSSRQAEIEVCARSQANGAGLGLAIVDRIVQRHRGKLDIKNREGSGLAVRIWLKSA